MLEHLLRALANYIYVGEDFNVIIYEKMDEENRDWATYYFYSYLRLMHIY